MPSPTSISWCDLHALRIAAERARDYARQGDRPSAITQLNIVVKGLLLMEGS
jgi:hypothetical protein